MYTLSCVLDVPASRLVFIRNTLSIPAAQDEPVTNVLALSLPIGIGTARLVSRALIINATPALKDADAVLARVVLWAVVIRLATGLASSVKADLVTQAFAVRCAPFCKKKTRVLKEESCIFPKKILH
jgi:hypothetical protein